MKKLKASEIKEVRDALLLAQGGVCAICKYPIWDGQAVLDHCHKGGHVRAVLHRSCNSSLGVVERSFVRFAVKNPEAFLQNVGAFLELHKTDQTGLTHHTFKTKDEKKALVTKRRKRNASK